MEWGADGGGAYDAVGEMLAEAAGGDAAVKALCASLAASLHVGAAAPPAAAAPAWRCLESGHGAACERYVDTAMALCGNNPNPARNAGRLGAAAAPDAPISRAGAPLRRLLVMRRDMSWSASPARRAGG